MKPISMLSMLALLLLSSTAWAGASIDVSISGYLPAPPGVRVILVGGRPCYREGGRIVYLKKDEGRHKGRRGHAYGHREHERHGHGNGHHGRHD